MKEKINPLKDKIFKFMKKHKGNRFSLTEISERTKVSYPSVMKWIDVLVAEDKIKLKNYGNVKLVWLE